MIIFADVLKETERGVAQSGSASALGAGGRRFESCHPDNNFKALALRLFSLRSMLFYAFLKAF